MEGNHIPRTKMHKDEAINILTRHLMQCGMLMPIEWLRKHGEGSEFMQAYEMAINALKNEPTPIIHAQWEDGYGLDSQNRITYWSIDCPVCRNVFKSSQQERCAYWKERFHYCPFCGTPMDIGREKEELIDDDVEEWLDKADASRFRPHPGKEPDRA